MIEVSFPAVAPVDRGFATLWQVRATLHKARTARNNSFPAPQRLPHDQIWLANVSDLILFKITGLLENPQFAGEVGNVLYSFV